MLRRLRRDARDCSAPSPRLLQMDIALPATCGFFRTILLPYSLITYVTDRRLAERVIGALAAMLEPGGCLVLDAFVPQPVQSFSDFRQDYRRAHGDGVLERHKRITANANGTNRIERRYRRYAGSGAIADEFVTDETIRPYAPEDLVALGRSARLLVDSICYDYGQTDDVGKARFVTVVMRSFLPA
jgi:hypothetical protein